MQSRPEPPSSAPTKPAKLRESCDSCLIAKVKCSKARPLCARCLANGAPCGYSVSARAGRKNRNSGISKANASTNNHRKSGNAATISKSAGLGLSSMLPTLNTDTPIGHEIRQDAPGTTTPPLTLEDQQHDMTRTIDSIDTTFTDSADSADAANMLPTPPFNGDFINAFLPIPTPESFVDFAATIPNGDGSISHLPESPVWTPNHTGASFAHYQSPLDIFTPTQPLCPHPPDPSQQSEQHPSEIQPARHEADHTCDCFATCIEVLQTLHQHSWMASSAMQDGIPFDIVLTINREAIDACSTMLNCSRCVSKSGSSIVTMLLSTIFGKVMSLYRAACILRFGSSTISSISAQLAFGAYTVTGEDRQLLEVEILLLELRKVETIFKSFQDKINAESDEKDEASVYIALIAYLDKNLRYIFDFLRSHKSNSSNASAT